MPKVSVSIDEMFPVYYVNSWLSYNEDELRDITQETLDRWDEGFTAFHQIQEEMKEYYERSK